MDDIELGTGLDVYFPGCDMYYKQKSLDYLPYADGSLLKPWQRYSSSMASINRKCRNAPANFEEACAYGSLAHIITFWARGHDVKRRLGVYEGSDATALMWACLRGHLNAARFLIDQGVSVNESNNLGHTALHWAMAGNHYDLARLLLDHGASPLKKDHQGYSAYFAAVQANNLPLLLMLCDYCPIDVNERDMEGHSLLHWAAYNNSLCICQYLIEKCRFDLDTLDYNGRTPLIWGAREGYSLVVEYLVSRGARTDIADMDNYTAFQYATFRNHREVMYVLSSQHQLMADGNNVNSPEDKNSFLRGRTSQTQYINVQQRRQRGTIKMMLQEKYFLFMSLLGFFYIPISYLILMFFPPSLSYIVFGAFFFKNTLWALIVGYPVQGSKLPLTNMQALGIARSFGESVRGIWLFRNRDASCLFAIIGFLIMQQYAWTKIGLAPIFTSNKIENPVLKLNITLSVYKPYEGNILGLFFYNKAEFERVVILFLFFLMLLSATICKLFSMRSVYEPNESSLDSSPVWKIIKQRAYRFLHPRIISMEKHMLIPLRTFYCYERDVFLKRFDGYSIALDCPVAESNHRWFFIFITSFACLQWLLFIWAWEQTTELLECPSKSSFLEWVTESSWFLLFFALPCPDAIHSSGKDYGWLLSWWWYIFPSQVNYLGVWVFQFGLTACIMASSVAWRQWAAAAKGATRVEMANPTATSTEGGLVTIFPPALSTATPWAPPIGVTEGATVSSEDDSDGGSANNNDNIYSTMARKRTSRCIYADSDYAVMNIFAFLLGRAGRRWRDAVAVSQSNTPLFTISALKDSLDTDAT